MGCCCSGHAEAKAVELPPPMYGKDIKVKLTKPWGMFGSDFDVSSCNCEGGEENPEKWMLLDAVGSINDSAFDYFLKYRAKGMQESKTLGCANLKKEHDYLWYEVTCTPRRQPSGLLSNARESPPVSLSPSCVSPSFSCPRSPTLRARALAARRLAPALWPPPLHAHQAPPQVG